MRQFISAVLCCELAPLKTRGQEQNPESLAGGIGSLVAIRQLNGTGLILLIHAGILGIGSQAREHIDCAVQHPELKLEAVRVGVASEQAIRKGRVIDVEPA
jgi:hypothetical protein